MRKGSRLQDGYRLIAKVQYSLSLFGGPTEVASTALTEVALWQMLPTDEHAAILGITEGDHG
jgi:hypothetical protein